MSVWGRIFAAGYDHLMSGPEKTTLRAHRQVLIPRARGRSTMLITHTATVGAGQSPRDYPALTRGRPPRRSRGTGC